MEAGYIISTKEKIRIKLISENLRRILYSAMVLALLLPVVFLVFLFIPIAPEVSLAFHGFLIGLELLVIAYFLLASYAMENKDFALTERIVYSYWCLVSLFLFGLAYTVLYAYGDLIVYYILLICLTTVALFCKRDAIIFLSAQGVIILGICIYLPANLYQIVEVLIFNLLLILISRLVYAAQMNTFELRQKVLSISKDAEEDPLTGLLNRRGLEHNIGAKWVSCIQKETTVALLILDIDFFKRYNDTYGHPQGDKCLSIVASVLLSCADVEQNLVARIGGEEFLVFVPNTSEIEAVKLAETIRCRVEQLGGDADSGMISTVTISVGVAAMTPKSEEEFDKLYEKADKALYYAKKNGRNVTVCGTRVYGRKRKDLLGGAAQ